MPDAYTYISKPVSSTYSFVTFQGKELYDQENITYDQANIYYDGVNQNAYTMVSKPTNSVYTYVSKPTT